MNFRDPETNRIHWQCRRSMLELDLLLTDFLEKYYPELCQSARQEFVRLLNFPDQSLQRWLLGDAKEIPPGMQRIVKAIREGCSEGGEKK